MQHVFFTIVYVYLYIFICTFMCVTQDTIYDKEKYSKCIDSWCLEFINPFQILEF